MSVRDIYVLLQLIGVVIMFAEIIYVLAQKPSRIQTKLVVGLITLVFAFVAYIVELRATNQETAYIGCVLGYLGKPFAFISILFLLLEYSHIKIKKGWAFAIIIYFTILTVIVFTNEFHSLYYSTLDFDESKLGSPLVITHGPFWYVYMASSFTVFGAYTVIVLNEFKYAKNKQTKRMTLLLFLMMLCSVGGLAAFIMGITYSYDSTLFGTLLGSICLFILLIKYHFFDSLTLAKDNLINDSVNGYIVLDAKEEINYFNKKALLFAPELKDYLSHKKMDEIVESLNQYKEGVPIIREGKVYSFNVKSYYAGKHEDRLIGKAFTFTDITDQFDYQQRLQDDVRKSTKKIEAIQKSILISFANLVEARDGYTGAHIKNVANIAKAIAERMSYDPKYENILTKYFIRAIEECSPLHDVGKIKIPDVILGKPGKLTPEEFEIIKTHTSQGGIIIDNVFKDVEEPEYVKIAKNVALYHHERFDGTGYPEKLKGTDIPLEARITAVADVYDALRKERPYKAPMPKEKAIEIMKEESGTHFDPEVLDAFLKIVDYID